ncbi:MAG: hypothetical protein DRP03_03335 [Candidatus Aenigmatarchaeota archaeon]|nr:MAG: hypothetical protein DRP03_03335 [Candidatus Aenigmarchaeota archaeon]
MVFMERYDIVVVGVGPAGSSVARVCAENGLNVLAIEKRQEIGSPKRCGEGLSKSSAERMGIEVKEWWIRQTIYGASVYAPNGKCVRIDYEGPEGWVIERKLFDKFLATEAANAGAKIIAKAEAIGVERDKDGIKVKIKRGNELRYVHTKILVACDGIESKIARMMGMNTALKLIDTASAVQYEMANVDIDEDRIELYFGNNIAPGGYVWIFPKGKRVANVGIGVRAPMAKKRAIEYLNEFIAKHEGLANGSIIEVNAGGVPVGGFIKDMVMDNFMVVGDAAHQVNPIHGGGIAEAYIAGRIAGNVASDAIRKGDCSAKTLSKYNKIWWSERGNKLSRILKLRKVVESLSDSELNWLAEYLKGEDLVRLARSSGLKRLAMILMKKPKLIKLAKSLL